MFSMGTGHTSLGRVISYIFFFFLTFDGYMKIPCNLAPIFYIDSELKMWKIIKSEEEDSER